MCGICGIISLKVNQSDRGKVAQMVDSLDHRGPDANGLWASENGLVHFGHTRLRIIDLDSRSDQPFHSQDGRFTVTFNGQIYNYQELRKECELLGSKFLTESDTEVFVESFRNWGEKCFAKFKGMWAAVIYDSTTNQVCISRDFFGIKPLYFAKKGGKLFFASEIKALKALNESFSEIDEVTVRMYVEEGILDRGNWTFYKEIKRFPHCSYAFINLENESLDYNHTIYWSPFDVSYAEHMYNEESVVRGFQDLFEKSIKLHCVSDVGVGSCLSGGLDSSSIVAYASSQRDNFSTFTAKFPEYPAFDESEIAAKLSQQFATQQYNAEPTIRNFRAESDEILLAQDEPYGSTSIFAQYMVFKRIKEVGVKVILDGQGADELLGGYLSLTHIALNSYFNSGRYFSWVTEIFNFSRRQNRNYFFNFASVIKSRILKKRDTYFSFNSLVTYKYSDSFEERMASLNAPPSTNLEHYLVYLTFDSNLQQLLRYEDRNSMHFSIESRVPFLEPDLVSFALQIPFEFKLKNGFTKYVLRKTMEGKLPDDVVWNPNKLAFEAPEADILRSLYNINVAGTGSKEWRTFIVDKWRRLTTLSKQTL